MPNAPYSGAPLPGYSDANDLAAALDAYSDVVDSHYVLFANSVAERDTLYSDVPEHTLVSCADLGALWQKTSTGWKTLLIDTGWVTTGFSYPTAAWDPVAPAPRVRNRNGLVQLQGTVVYSGSDVTVGANGNIVDQSLLQMPAGYHSTYSNFYGHGSSSGVGCTLAVNTSGVLVMIAGTANQVITVGNTIAFSLTWLLDS